MYNHLTVCKQMNPRSFKNFIYKLYLQFIYMYKENLALNNLQWLICHKTQPHPAQLAGAVEYANCISAEG